MKLLRIFLNAIFMFILGCCFGQEKVSTDLKEFENAGIKTLELKAPSTRHNLLKNITSVTVVDERPVKTAVGFYYSENAKLSKFQFKEECAVAIQQWLKNFISPAINADTNYNFLMVIKKLWLSQDLDPYIDSKRAIEFSSHLYEGVMAKFEFYVFIGEKYYPLYRFDSSFTVRRNLLKNADDVIDTAIIVSLDKMKKINIPDWVKKHTSISFNEIVAYNERTIRMLSLKETSSPNRGVYKTFNEFKTNNPSIKNYELKKDKFSDMLYAKDDEKNEYPIRFAWGYCDGSKIFIKSGDKYFPLNPFGNTYFFKGYKNLSLNEAQINAPNSFNSIHMVDAVLTSKYYKYYLLDPESGEFY